MSAILIIAYPNIATDVGDLLKYCQTLHDTSVI